MAWMVVLGCGIIVILISLRACYSYQIIRTAHFVIWVPRPWSRGVVYVVALLELCQQTACATFALTFEDQAEIEIRPSWRPAFWLQPESRRIVLCFVFGPAIDRWLFSIYFAIAHEYGHWLSQVRVLVEDEAWADFFSLYTLYIVMSTAVWPNTWERYLMRRDALLGLVVLYIWQWIPGQRRKIARRFWELWRTREKIAVMSLRP